jgi:sucrose-6-phosphate hydrolase SacC (GH32 family)
LGEDECQAGGDILFHEGRYHMFFSYRHPVGYKTKSKGYRIGYAGSDDLKHWVRHDEAAGLDVSPDGWDSEMVSYAHVFKHQGQVFMLYQGNAIGRCGFGLAVMESYVEGGGS